MIKIIIIGKLISKSFETISKSSGLNPFTKGNDAKKAAAAGVGKPKKLNPWRSSILNFANRRADAITKIIGEISISIWLIGKLIDKWSTFRVDFNS